MDILSEILSIISPIIGFIGSLVLFFLSQNYLQQKKK